VALRLERQTVFLQCTPNHAGLYQKYGFSEMISQDTRAALERLCASMACVLTESNLLLEAARADAELMHLMNAEIGNLETTRS
jgi:hypothetical protein